MKESIIKNYLTTAFGILAGLPVLVTQSFAAMNAPLSPKLSHILLMAGAVGLIGLGIVSKAFNAVPTQTEVDKATNDAANK